MVYDVLVCRLQDIRKTQNKIGCIKLFNEDRFEVLAEVVMRSSIFWDITPCSPAKVNRRFEGKYILHLQG
jgi:hypothetical protein